MRRILDSIPLLYVALLWPGRFAIWGLFDDNWYYAQMMHETGVWSVRILVLSLSVTPILMILGRLNFGRSFGRWLLQRRKHFGRICFIYAALHLAHYVLETQSLTIILLESVDLEFATGWLGFGILLAMAITSNKYSTRKLGRRWKTLHRWIYAGSVLIFLHWLLFDDSTHLVIYWAGILVVAKGAHAALTKMPRTWARSRTA